MLDGLRDLLPPAELRHLRDFAQGLLSQCDSETWKGPFAVPSAEPPARWREAETPADRVFYDRGWNEMDSGFKLF